MSARRAAGWAGLLAAESVVRIGTQIGVTAILARMLAPEAFGLAALALSVAMMLAIPAGGVAFEETLAQRRVVRRRHYEAALAASWAAGAVCMGALWAAGPAVAAALGDPALGPLLLLAGSLLFAQAPLSILTALARRRRRFDGIALSSFLGHVVGGAAAVGAALQGYGAEALVGFRVVVTAATALALALLLRVWILPRFSRRRLYELAAFTSLSMAERGIENATYLIFNYLTGALYGLTALGYLNMALRTVEPLRGALSGIAHNLAFPFLRAPDAPGDRGETVTRAMHVVGVVAAPAFLGVAAVADEAIDVIAGPGWDAAAPAAALLAVGSALSIISAVTMTATNARGAPSINLVRRVIGFAVLVAALAAAAPLGMIATALARLAADLAETLWCLGVARWRLGARWTTLAARFGGPVAAAGLMAVAVRALGARLPPETAPIAALAMQAAAGAVLYAVVVALSDRAARDMVRAVASRRVVTPSD